MSTVEATVSIMENMTPEEQKYVYEAACEIIAARKPRNPFKPLTQQQILEDLALSRQQVKEGKTTEAREALTAMGEKYGFI
ncbi:MAG: hypothetical protein IJ109_01080 [Firmicutes bacterium]|nr:hypothetical protein [Bacillota bacterium]